MKRIDSQHLENLILEWGASLVGFAELTGLVPNEDEHLPYGIAIAIRLSDAVMDGIANGPTRMYVKLRQTVNSRLDRIGAAIVSHLEGNGFKTHLIPVSQYVSSDEQSLPHKTVATRGGLGWIGRNNLLITPQFGPRVRLISVLTNAQLKTAKPISLSMCGDCSVCIDSCPANALKGAFWDPSISNLKMVDFEECEKHIEKYERKLNAPVCGICISVCPVGTRRLRKI
ncbi:MAG: 4Fe-4S double cluster binding domain-containing protein [Promethearchaeota archaeon]